MRRFKEMRLLVLPIVHGLGKYLRNLLFGRRWLLILATFLIVELLVLGSVFERPELNLYDAWFRLSGAHDPGSQVVILDCQLKHG